jgi:hypothetical protein
MTYLSDEAIRQVATDGFTVVSGAIEPPIAAGLRKGLVDLVNAIAIVLQQWTTT